MFRFIKTPNINDEFNNDVVTVEVQLHNNHLSRSEVLEEFARFMQACGYHFTDEEIEELINF